MGILSPWFLLFFCFALPVSGRVINVSSQAGNIKSPNYPNTYPSGQDISWRLTVKAGYRVVLRFTKFNVGTFNNAKGSCDGDFLEISTSDGKSRKFCGNSPEDFSSTPTLKRDLDVISDSVTLRFVSASTGTPSNGFAFEYKIVDRDECREQEIAQATAYEDWEELLYCTQKCHNTVGGYYCSCDKGFHLHSNKHTCTSDCSGLVLTEERGKITSSRYPEAYSKLANCDWTIKAKDGISIEMRFTNTFSIEKHYEDGCVYDWLEYWANGKVSEKYCGKTKPNNGDWIQTNSPAVKVVFVSDMTEEQSGFEMEYKFNRVKCKEKLMAPENGGIITPTREEWFEFEDVVKFTCSKGFLMVGAKFVTCQKDGTWSGKVPRCEAIVCQPPKHITGIKYGGRVTGPTTLAYGGIVSVTCKDDWYEMTSGAAEWICGDEALWVPHSQLISPNAKGNVPECSLVCGLKGNKRVTGGGLRFRRDAPVRAEPRNFVVAVVGGRTVKTADEWPWMAFIDLFGEGLQTNEFCGGSLISARTVITAAHCTRRTYKDSIQVFLGAADRFNPSPTVQKRSVSDMYEHKDYSEATFDNDIAILILNKAVTIGLQARPICLPRSQREQSLPDLARTNPNHQKTGVLAGWGITETGRLPLILNSARIEPIEQTQCSTTYEKTKPPSLKDIKITGNMLCAGYPDNAKNRDSCQGDSGGPYAFKEPVTNRYFLNGVVSFGSTENCGGGTFGIYTRVSKYIEWIDNHMVS